MVIMIYRMMAQDLARFGTVFVIFVCGYAQAMFIMFRSFQPDDEDDEECDGEDIEECYVSAKLVLSKCYVSIRVYSNSNTPFYSVPE